MDIPGFSADSLGAVQQMLYGEINWAKQFQDGKGPGPQNPGNYHTGISKKKGPGQLLISKTGVKGDLGKQKVNNDSEMLAPVSFPRGPANPMSGSSKDVQGMRMLG
jgi:hypothetical protein